MGRERDATRRKLLRKNRQNLKRQNTLITDYIQHKYHNVYTEAFQFYTKLNDQYPDKTDLRKTDVYKFWKFGCVHHSSEQEQEPQSPVGGKPQEQKPQSPANSELQEQEQEPPSPPSNEPQGSQSRDQDTYTDNLQLKIPIKRYRTIKHGQSVTTQTLCGQEQLSTIQIPETPQPTLLDELPTDLVQEIIDQLSEDPDLMNTFDMIEEQFNLEELDIEIPDNLLEKELENW